MSGGAKLKKKNYINQIRELLVIITDNEDFFSIPTNVNILYSGFDSMKAVRLIMALEQKYRFQIDADDFAPSKINTIDNINEIILHYINKMNLEENNSD